MARRRFCDERDENYFNASQEEFKAAEK